MTPKLHEPSMLSRGANLSARKPLLRVEDRPQNPPAARRAAVAADAFDAAGPAPSVFKFERRPQNQFADGNFGNVAYSNLRSDRVKGDAEGPFVFGVHSPSQFQIRSRLSDADVHDCVHPDDKTVINDGSTVNYCDKRPDSRPRCDFVDRDGMFSIKNNRSERQASDAEEKKAKQERRDKRRCRKTKERIKCVLVGDGAVGKTSLITSYAQNTFQERYVPTAFDNFNVVVQVDGRPVNVEICDTAGQDSLADLRELCYPGTDVLVLCFSVVKPETFRSITKRWAPAVTRIKAPLILIGTQIDLLDDPRTISDLYARGDRPVSEYEIKQLASKLKAPYVETSARQRVKLKDAFDTAILAGLRINQSRKPIWKKLFCIS